MVKINTDLYNTSMLKLQWKGRSRARVMFRNYFKELIFPSA